MKRKTMMSWSSGKDSAWSLYQLQKDPTIELTGLFCTINKKHDSVAMHGVSVELLKRQADSIGLPLEIIEIPDPCSNADYERIMGQFVRSAIDSHVECFAFGDLFLEDIRTYREEKLRDSGIDLLFPLWGLPTKQLSKQMLEGGLKTLIACVDPKQVPENLVGRVYDQGFLDALPDTADPCGENGEFHSFVFDGPMFMQPIPVEVGDVVRRDGHVYADIRPMS